MKFGNMVTTLVHSNEKKQHMSMHPNENRTFSRKMLSRVINIIYLYFKLFEIWGQAVVLTLQTFPGIYVSQLI